MITAESFQKAQRTLNEAQNIVDVEMPNAKVVFVGADNDYLFFNVIAKRSQVTDQQIKDIKEKTRFETITEHDTNLLWRSEFKINLWV
jgi:lipopolysaccharide export LptBFGC system permease protein LptF